DYRIEYAKQLMVKNPEMKVGNVGTASGFSSEQTFFRIFKQATGQTPGDWRSKL
ncbi:MAG: helix-turn-helix domain-containing protein, partial [Bacteroidaceae bacterium]|nr:helix-turn-helix domain-containing protein [Bacteroidaceae bacterium]